MMSGAMGWWSRPLAVLAAVVALAGSAAAESLSTTVERWGLLGTWSAACSRPPDRKAAIRLAFVIVGNALVERRDFGDGQDEIDVPSATVSEDGVLHLRLFLNSVGETRAMGLAHESDGALRTVYNRNLNSDVYSVKDGRFVANGKPTPLLRRCE